MPGRGGKHHSKKFKFRYQSQDEVQEVTEKLKASDIAFDWKPGANETISFSSLLISSKTIKGLTEGGFTEATDIQSRVLPHALYGRDILASARTGSGKTLSFIIPLLERLFLNRWSQQDGLGGLIIAPTRELAMQIFEVLRIVGKWHSFSAGLVTGGKTDFAREQTQIGTINILVSTPGRLLQHLEQSANFNIQSLQVLILDEADHLLDMGFQQQINRIIEYLPPPPSHVDGQIPRRGRQTLLFSATVNKHVNALVKLFLPPTPAVMIGIDAVTMKTVFGLTPSREKSDDVDDDDVSDMPKLLTQLYITTPLPNKLVTLYSFIKSHTKNKMIVFVSTAAQVRFIATLLSSLSIGMQILGLHGKSKQIKRTSVYFEFERVESAVLLATDVASRGLDFPAVDWVIQYDAPESAELYIHRVGRTARFKSKGQSLLMLNESEASFVNLLRDGGVTQLKSVQINQKMMIGSYESHSRYYKSGKPQLTLTEHATSLNASDPAIKLLAQKAFKSYLRSIMLMPNQEVFQIRNMPLRDYALSLGLADLPNLDFLGKVEDREARRSAKNKNWSLLRLKHAIMMEKLKKKIDKLQDLRTQCGLSDGNDDDDADDIPNKLKKLIKKGQKWKSDLEMLERDGPGAVETIKSERRMKSNGNNNADLVKELMYENEVQGDIPAISRILDEQNDDDDNFFNVVSTTTTTKRKVEEPVKSVKRQRNDDDERAAVGVADLSRERQKYLDRIKLRISATQDDDKQRERDRLKNKRNKKKDQMAKMEEEEEEEEEAEAEIDDDEIENDDDEIENDDDDN